jgi:hypothetical protein
VKTFSAFYCFIVTGTTSVIVMPTTSNTVISKSANGTSHQTCMMLSD